METAKQHHGVIMEQVDPTPAEGTQVWNVLTALVWVGTVSLVAMFVSLIVNPASSFNPFPPVTPMPPTLVAAIQLPTQTHTPDPDTVLASSTGPTNRSGRSTRTPTASPTPTTIPTRTSVPTETPTPGPSPTKTVYSLYPFKLMDDHTNYIAANTFPNHDTCRIWVAGRVYDLSNSPVVGMVVRLGGWLDGTKNIDSLTGTATDYGPSGYEILVSDLPANSTGDLWVQLFGQGDIPMSNRVYFDTFDDCSRNLILINFKQVR